MNSTLPHFLEGAVNWGLERLSLTGKLCALASENSRAQGQQSHFGVVVADDDPDSVRGLARILKSRGYAVHQAIGGCQAVIVAKARRPRVAIVEYMMRDLGGIEAIRRIQDESPDIEVILTTSLHPCELPGSAAGLTCVRKPLDIPDLLGRIARLASAGNGKAQPSPSL